MMPFGLGQCRRAFDKSESLAEIPEAIGTLDPPGVIEQRPIGRLCAQPLGFVGGQAAECRRGRVCRFYQRVLWP